MNIPSLHPTLTRRADAPAPSPAPTPAPADATFSYNAQDEVVFPTTTTVVHNVTISPASKGGDNLSTDKVTLNATLAPKADGTFVYDPKDQENLTSAQTFATVNKTVDTMSAALGAPITWSFDGKLGINPDAGEDFNAYYDRGSSSVNFFHGTDPKTNQVIMSGGSGEVVSHETGHAILDSVRPAYLGSFTLDVGAFHEAFGDMTAMMMAFQDDKSVSLCAQQTGGDLTKQNCIAALGEEIGIAINDVTGQNATGGPYTRNAINNFKWQDPSTLPSDGGPDVLISEVHSFSRLWTGAFYDIMTGIQARNMASGMDAATALKATGQEGLKLLSNLLKEAPQGDFTYRDMANAFVTSDQKYNNGADSDLITKVMTDRGILGAAPTPTPAPPSGSKTDAAFEQNMANQAAAGLSSPSGSLSTMTADGRKPLSSEVRPVNVRLSGSGRFGNFEGALVQTLVDKDGSLSKDAEISNRVKSSIEKLIAQGRIRYNDPSYKMKIPQDLFDAKGRPYVGITRWENGQMIIERNKIVD